MTFKWTCIHHCCFPLPCVIITSVGMPDRMSKYMSDRLAWYNIYIYMSDRISEYIWEIIHIYSTVGITRSKTNTAKSPCVEFSSQFLGSKIPMFVPEIILSPSNYHIPIFLLPCSLFLKSPYFSIKIIMWRSPSSFPSNLESNGHGIIIFCKVVPPVR